MAYPSVFLESSKSDAFARLDALTVTTPRQWGSMTSAQMLAHLNVPYEYTFGEPSLFYSICQGAFQQAESEFLVGIIQIVKRGSFTPS